MTEFCEELYVLVTYDIDVGYVYDKKVKEKEEKWKHTVPHVQTAIAIAINFGTGVQSVHRARADEP